MSETIEGDVQFGVGAPVTLTVTTSPKMSERARQGLLASIETVLADYGCHVDHFLDYAHPGPGFPDAPFQGMANIVGKGQTKKKYALQFWADRPLNAAEVTEIKEAVRYVVRVRSVEMQ